MSTIIMAVSSSFAGKAAILPPIASNNFSQGCVTMRKTIAKPRLVISAAVQSLDKSAQPVAKSKNPFRKIKPSTGKPKQKAGKPTVKRTSKYLSFRKFLISIHREIPKSGQLEVNTRVRKKSARRINRRFFIRSRKQIHYKKIRVIGRFIGYQGKIIPRRVSRLSMTNQRLMTTAIKKARILGLLPFTENEKHIKRVRWKNVINRRRTKRGRKPRRDQGPKRPYSPRT